jgi:hypothetical protein
LDGRADWARSQAARIPTETLIALFVKADNNCADALRFGAASYERWAKRRALVFNLCVFRGVHPRFPRCS